VAKKIPNVPLMVVGNKVDLVNLNDLKGLLKEKDIAANYLSSAKTGSSVNEMFSQLASLLNEHA
jgi:50S ribosomal subunit-associated GTPase HflX